MIEPAPHTDAEQSWEAISKWIAEKVKMPDGRPLEEAMVKVLAVGAVIGARFSLLMPPFALGLAEYSNLQSGPLWASIQHGFIEDYAEAIARQVDAMYHNYGFTNIHHEIQVHDDTPQPELAPLTEADAKQILEGLDGLFGGNEGAA